jgi:hypothetical protein
MPKQWALNPAKVGVPANADFECPHCGVHSLHHLVGGDVQYTDDAEMELGLPKGSYVRSQWVGLVPCRVTLTHWIMRCVKCQRDTYILTKGQAVASPNISLSPDETNWLRSRASTVHQYPIAFPTVHKAVPESVSESTVEAEKCLGVGAFNACGVMTRRAMHSLCEDKGGTGKDLFAQLQDLRDSHLITPDLWQWAEELRVLGKHGAHPEFPEVNEEEAEYGVKFLREIIRFVYINPYERSQKRLKETSKKKP